MYAYKTLCLDILKHIKEEKTQEVDDHFGDKQGNIDAVSCLDGKKCQSAGSISKLGSCEYSFAVVDHGEA